MATITESLNFVLKGDPNNAVRAFQKVEQASQKSLGAAEKSTDKTGQTFDKIGRGLSKFGTVAIATGAAAAAGLVKVALGFEKGALAAGKFSDATGVSVEQASRLIEVSGDLGVESTAVEGAINKMNKAIGTGSPAFEKYGIAIAKAKDGSVDANQTFLNTIDRLNQIQDPAERAAAGTAIFGKNWTSMAEVIARGAPALKAALASVDPSQVFTSKDVQSAKEFRDAFENLKDAGQQLSLSIGRGVLPVLSTLVTAATSVANVFGGLPEPIKELVGTTGAWVSVGLLAAGAFSKIAGAVISYRASILGLPAQLAGVAAAQETVAIAQAESLAAADSLIASVGVTTPALADLAAADLAAAGATGALTEAQLLASAAFNESVTNIVAAEAALGKAQSRAATLGTAMKGLGLFAGEAVAFVAVGKAIDSVSHVSERLAEGIDKIVRAAGEGDAALKGFSETTQAMADKFLDAENVGRGLLDTFGFGGSEIPKWTKAQEAFNKVLEESPRSAAALIPFLEKHRDEYHLSTAQLGKFRQMVEDNTKTEAAAGQAAQDHADDVRAVTDAAELGIDVEGKSVDAIKAEVEARKTATAALKDHADALQNDIDLLLQQAAVGGDVAAANIAYSDAQTKATDATNATTAAIAAYNKEPTAENLLAVRDAVNGERDALIDAANAAGDLAVAHSVATTEAGKAVDRLNAVNSSLIATATTATPQARTAIGNYLADLNEIPPTKRTEFMTILATGDQAKIKAFILANSGTFDALFKAEADQGALNQTNSELDAAADPRTATISAQASTAAGTGGIDAWIHQQESKVINIPVQARLPKNLLLFGANGGNPGPGEPMVVGEAGPEFVDQGGRRGLVTGPTLISGPAHVTSASQTAAMLRQPVQAGHPVVNNISINLPPGADSDSRVVAAIQRWAKRNGHVNVVGWPN